MVRINFYRDGGGDFADEFLAGVKTVWGGAKFGPSGNRTGIFAYCD